MNKFAPEKKQTLRDAITPAIDVVEILEKAGDEFLPCSGNMRSTLNDICANIEYLAQPDVADLCRIAGDVAKRHQTCQTSEGKKALNRAAIRLALELDTTCTNVETAYREAIRRAAGREYSGRS